MNSSRHQAAGRRPGQADAGGPGTSGEREVPAEVAMPTEQGRQRRRGGWRVASARRVRIAAVALLAFGAAVSAGCEPGDDGDNCWRPDTTPPAVPCGLWSMTGDREVRVMWIANSENDLDGYRIYRSTEPSGYFPRIATLHRGATSFTDRDVHNGVTYYYSMSAFDYAGNESDLVGKTIHDTPRPEGGGLRLDNARLDPRLAGYDFSADRVVGGEDIDADIYYWHSPEEGAWMVATDRSADDYTEIQDAGYFELDDVDWAPDGGWAPAGEVPLVEGHCYIVWTWDNHFAKFRVASVTADRAVIDWAYQVDEGNPELIRAGSAVPPRPALTGPRAHRIGLPGRIAS
jgi:hypothetical protein